MHHPKSKAYFRNEILKSMGTEGSDLRRVMILRGRSCVGRGLWPCPTGRVALGSVKFFEGGSATWIQSGRSDRESRFAGPEPTDKAKDPKQVSSKFAPMIKSHLEMAQATGEPRWRLNMLVSRADVVIGRRPILFRSLDRDGAGSSRRSRAQRPTGQCPAPFPQWEPR